MWVVANVCEEGFKEVGDGIEKERIHKVLEKISEVLRVVRWFLIELQPKCFPGVFTFLQAKNLMLASSFSSSKDDYDDDDDEEEKEEEEEEEEGVSAASPGAHDISLLGVCGNSKKDFASCCYTGFDKMGNCCWSQNSATVLPTKTSSERPWVSSSHAEKQKPSRIQRKKNLCVLKQCRCIQISLSRPLLSSMFSRTSVSLVVFLYSKLFGTKKLFFAQNMEKLLVGGSGFAWIAALVQLNSLQSVWIPF
jgi:hypothetical protein